MPVSKSYLDHFYVRNLTKNHVSIGDLVNLSIPGGKRVDLLTIPLITKEKINQSHALQDAIRQGLLRIEKESCRKRKKPKREREATISDENLFLCDVQDIKISGLSDDDILVYNGSTGLWENEPPTDIDINLNIVEVNADYTTTETDDLLLCDASQSNITITLSSSEDGKVIHVKKIDATGNEIRVEPPSGSTIDGESFQIIDVQFDCMDICCLDGTNWAIV